jgi:RND family efflux transporter MFP subunit
MSLRPSLLLPLVLAACSKSGHDAGAQRRNAEPKPVRVAAAAIQPLPRTLTVSGTLAADEEADLGFKVQGRIAKVSVDLGSRVRRGDVLAALEPADFELRVQQALAALQQARARLNLPIDGDADSIEPEKIEPEKIAVVAMARSTLEDSRLSRDRIKELVSQQLRSDSDLDAANAAFDVARARHQDALEEVRQRQAVLAQRKAELALARQALQDATLTAPFDGAIRERHASPGHFVTAGSSVMTIVKTDPLRLRLFVPEREASAIKELQEVRMSLEGDAAVRSGFVARLAPALGETNRTLSVEATIENPDGTLRPGSFARATIVVAKEAPGLCVPAEALVRFAGIEKVVLFKSGKAEERRVRSGRADAKLVEIVEGLEAGDQVVLAPAGIVTGDALVVR